MSKLMEAQAEFLLNFCSLVDFATAQGFTVTAGELLRPVEMQKIYVETGRSKTMNSKHLQKLAGDLNFFLPSAEGKLVYICSVHQLEPLGRYWESLNPKNRWGGNFDMDWSREDNFKDAPHFERIL